MAYGFVCKHCGHTETFHSSSPDFNEWLEKCKIEPDSLLGKLLPESSKTLRECNEFEYKEEDILALARKQEERRNQEEELPSL